MFRTYTQGLTLKTTKIITKNDIIDMCDLLNNREEYSDLCTFHPEPITEGGIVFKFKEPGFDPNTGRKWYKTVRFQGKQAGDDWYPVNVNTVLSEWTENYDIIFNPKRKFYMFLKSFHGAPLFTQQELQIWEECFNNIGIIKVGKYPSAKSLKTSISAPVFI